MPRRRRDDFQPLVRIPEHRLQPGARDRFANEISDDDEVIVRERKRNFREEDKFFTLNDNVLALFERASISVNKSDNRFAAFNYGVFIKLWRFVPISKCIVHSTLDGNTGALTRDVSETGVLNRMIAVGCRVMHTGIAALATEIGVSTSTLEKQLCLYREIGLIVNEANAGAKRLGFVEFDAMVGWRGRSEHRDAYRSVQRVHTFVR